MQKPKLSNFVLIIQLFFHTHKVYSPKSIASQSLLRKCMREKSILIIEALGCCTLLNLYVLQIGKSGAEKSSLLLYQTCLDPFKSSFTIPFFEVIPFNQALLHIANWCTVFFNLAIYKHLDKEAKNNVFQMDQLKIRRRNLVSAKIGIYHLALLVINWSCLSILYSISIDLGI